MLPALAATAQVAVAKESAPNIIFILTDDLGYGDISSLNEEGKIPTPNVNAMVERGVSFSDAHTSSSVSTPTRYGVLTGRYNWRSTLKSSVVSGYSKALITPDRTSMGALLKRANYTTAYIGKWHVGWDWHYTEQPTKIDDLSANNKGVIDYTQPIKNGPKDIGFDYSYGFCGSLDMPPYVYVENGYATELPDHETEGKGFGSWRKGPTSPSFVHEECLGHFIDKSIEFMAKASKKRNTPFFLYLPLPAPHTPILPTEEWAGKSGLNPYADFVMETDYEVGRLMTWLKESGLDENTIVVFTSDNGCSPRAEFEDLGKLGHDPSYIYRGMKSDLFEGGHRVPCVVTWGSKLTPGESKQTICLTDFFSTFAEIAGVEVMDNEGEDSFSVLSALMDPSYSKPIRKTTIHHGINGDFAIRSGDWKLITIATSGGWSSPKPSDKEIVAELPPMQLYNIVDDPEETTNLYDENPQKVKELMALLRKDIQNGRSTEGEPQSNETKGRWKQLEVIFN